MFKECRFLKNINLSNFNTQNVVYMNCMFKECNYLTNINLSNFITQKVTDMSYIYSNNVIL